jgi:hypothetical protein
MSFSDRNPSKHTTKLHNAALDGDFAKVQGLKESDPEFLNMLTTRDHNQDLPLDRAAARGHYPIVELLVKEHKINKKPYFVNSRNYSALLSAIRWYCKVLDGTYKERIVVGEFNTGETKDNDYLNVIKLLMKEYPEHIHKVDNKNLYGLHYVFFHFREAIKNKNDTNINALKQLIMVLIQNGMSPYLLCGEESPFSMATQNGDHPFLNTVKQAEDSINSNPIPCLETDEKEVSAQTTSTSSSSSDSSKSRNLARKKSKPVSASRTSNQFEYLIGSVDPINITDTEVPDRIENSEKINESLSKIKKDNIHPTGIKEKHKTRVNDKHFKVNKDKKQNESKANIKKEYYEKLADDIFENFKLTVNYKPSGEKDNLKCAEIKKRMVELLNDNYSHLDKKFSQNKRKRLIINLSKSLSLESITTGFLCCRKTKKWIALNEETFTEALINNKKKLKFS